MPRSLTEGSIPVGLFKFSLPILLANILQSLNGSVNSIWVGRFLGEAALTATSNANTVMFLLIGAAFGVALAATILIAQRIGANGEGQFNRWNMRALGQPFRSTAVIIGGANHHFRRLVLQLRQHFRQMGTGRLHAGFRF